MNKTLTIVFILLAMGLIVFNFTLLDFQNPFVGDSLIAVIGIVASLCAILLLLILWKAKNIERRVNGKD
ncbi:PucC family protein [Flagellimonas lutaonensis]|uniref:Membrane protein n=1 Tax=Flagellimonas lutaonensis TaxID=516051 RepID=A0A0D5YTC5_9FLAO|nr:PucC family protein [Allomuricauda lutaonensis]AKA35149.1 membrane protein [Allomuricauda lutaonensis]